MLSSDNTKNGHSYEIPDEFWNKIKPLFLLPKPKKACVRPRKEDNRILSVIYLLHNGCQLEALPLFYGVPSTVHDRFQDWRKSELSEQM